MAKEKIEFQVTPERSKIKDDILRRNSTGKPGTSNSGEKILPHYLRASTGSCHDFCKFGRKHAFETKAKHPMLKGLAATPAEGRDPVQSVALLGRKKLSLVKLNPSPDSKTQLLDKPKIKIKPKIYKREVSSPAKKVYVSPEQASSAAKQKVVSAKYATVLKPKPVAAKPSSAPLIPSGILSSRRNSDAKIGQNMGASKIGEKKLFVPLTASLSPKPFVNKAASLNAIKYKNPKVVSPLKNQNGIRKAEPKQPNNDQVLEKILYVIELKAENKSSGPAQNGSDTIQSFPSTSSPSPTISPVLSSHEGEEHEDSVFTLTEADDSISELYKKNKNQIETSKLESKRLPRRGATDHPQDKDFKPQKLNFRRGQVIDLQSEKNGVRRLRFRQGRALGENQNSKGDVGKRSFIMREVVNGDANGTKSKSEEVILRHQHVQEKKDTQGLFNNVIEETASKLVETRKSKVKALVGAFETVISLQDGKPSTNSTN
ncbi:hypothetical protein HHK36_024271 [Tetracentron sinense]|uniref:Calmodulin-binding domain-containing protein n=1 Tax=Tetracentron sinense TaxID=13715 RepID=A0A834YPE8_TETSI|nr:hypothetical protein HHK36_024271 [Tetracentron sinense]